MGTNNNNGWNDVSNLRVKLSKIDFAYEESKQILGHELAEASYKRMFEYLQDELNKFFVVGIMSKQSYKAHLNLLSSFYESHQQLRVQHEGSLKNQECNG